jgi:hypothetical protein
MSQSDKGFVKSTPELIAGFFPVRRRNSLLQSEVEWLENHEKERLKVLLPLLRLAAQISVGEGIEVTEALNKVQALRNGQQTGDNIELVVKYIDEFEDVVKADFSEQEYRRQIAVLTINSRVSQKWIRENLELIEEEFEVSLKEDEDNKLFWKDSDGKSLPFSLIECLCQFHADEKNGGKEPVRGAENIDLGKSSQTSKIS